MRKIAIYGIIVATAAVAGVGGGTIVKRFFTEAERDYSGFDPTVYKIDADKVIANVESYESRDLAFRTLDGAELVNYALEKYKRCENSYSYGIGMAETIVSQAIRNAQIKNGNTYFEESVSKSSMVGVAHRNFQVGTNGDCDIYEAPENSKEIIIDTAVSGYYSTPTHYSVDQYKALYGRSPSEMFNYIIHKDSILNFEKSEENGFYKIVLNLNPDIATYYYQFQMQTISHLGKKPTFSSVRLEFTLSNTLELNKLKVNESYKAVMGIEASISASILYVYHPNEFYKIPELQENIDYRQLSSLDGGDI